MTSSSAPPARVGRYELALSLGQGPLGELWAGAAAEGPEQGRLVSIRRIRFGGAAPDLRRLAARAAETARALRHPKLAAVLDVVELESELLVVSEYVEGELLSVLLKQATSQNAPIPASTAVAMIRDVTDGLLAVHPHFAASAGAPSPAGGLVPEGCVVAAFGDVMLLEPGVLAALGDARMRSKALAYRAPEELEAPPRRDERSDVYTLGVLLWEMLANRPLFRSHASTEADADADVRKLLLTAPAPALDSLPRQGAPLPAPLVVLVGRALLRDPNQRFASLRQFRTAFDELPKDLLAASEQVVVTLERLARSGLEARRTALSQLTEGGRLSLSPESMRTTARPPGPESAQAVVIPPLAVGIGGFEGFSKEEAPTRPRRITSPRVHAGAVTPPAEASVPALALGTPTLEPERDDGVPGREATSSGISVLDEVAVAEAPRRFPKGIVIGVGLLVILSLAGAFALRGAKQEAAPTAGARSAPTTPEAPGGSATAEPTSDPVIAPIPAGAEPRPSASSAPRRPRDDRPEQKPRNGGTYRPKGI